MGAVYRATDTKLDREVAIKILPDPLARDPDRLARFEREAKVLASLNLKTAVHPRQPRLAPMFTPPRAVLRNHPLGLPRCSGISNCRV